MPSQRSRRTLLQSLQGVAGASVLMASLTAGAAKPPVPAVRIPLADLGFPGYRVALMHAGASMATVHLLDKTHLLFTFGIRALVPRLPGDDAKDDDRIVGAEIIQIPTGKILERTEWHLHDHGRYLWNVGHGLFVLRSGDELSTFAPLHGLATHTSFERVSLPHRPGHPELVTGSPDGNIITVELQRKEDPDAEDVGDQPRHKHTTVEFFRILAPESPEQPMQLRGAGAIGSPALLRLALDGDGYLWAEDKERSRWAVSFNEYGGKGQDLATVDSSCNPRLELLSRGEFAVVTCSGNDDSQMLSAYGFDGHENWREPLHGESLQPPTITAAPEGGRFAMSRLLASSSGSPLHTPGLDDGTLSQEIRVYGTESGDLLFSLQCTPVLRTPENFDLSPDGRSLAVLGSDSINLYALPELTANDRKELAEAQAMTPPVNTGPVVLRRITRPIAAETPAIAAEETTAPQPATEAPVVAAPDVAGGAASSDSGPAAAPAASPSPAIAAGKTSSNGDATPSPRKPPTLLAPGEAAEYKDKGNKPQ